MEVLKGPASTSYLHPVLPLVQRFVGRKLELQIVGGISWSLDKRVEANAVAVRINANR